MGTKSNKEKKNKSDERSQPSSHKRLQGYPELLNTDEFMSIKQGLYYKKIYLTPFIFF